MGNIQSLGITSIILKKRIESGGGDNPYTVIYLPPKNLPDTSLDGEDPLSCCYTIGSDGRKISFRLDSFDFPVSQVHTATLLSHLIPDTFTTSANPSDNNSSSLASSSALNALSTPITQGSGSGHHLKDDSDFDDSNDEAIQPAVTVLMDLQAGYESMVFVADEGLPIDGARIQLTHFFSDVKAKSWGSSRFTMSGGNTSRKWEWRFSDIVYDRMSLSDYCKHHVILSSSANEVVCVNANGGASEEDTRPVVEFAFWSKSRDLDDQTPTATALGVNNVRSSVMSSSGGYESGSGDARSSRVRGEGSEETNGSSSTTTQQPSILQTRPSTHLDPSSSTVVPPLPPRKTSDANIFVRSVAAMRNTASSSPADSQSAKNTTSSSPPISTTSSSTNPIINIPASIIASLTSGKSSLSRSATKPPPVSSAINDGPVDDGPLFRETIANLEKKTAILKQDLKRIVKQINAYELAKSNELSSFKAFIESLRALPLTDDNILLSLQRGAAIIGEQTERYLGQLQTLLIDPLQQLYDNEIKPAEARKKQFDQESSDYNGFQNKYLSIKSDKNAKKKNESDSKYNARRKSFDLKRFDYYNQLQQLHDSHINLDISFTLVNFGQKQVSLYHNINKRLAAETKSYLDKAWEEISQASKIEHEQRKDRELKRKLIKSAGMARAFSYFSKEGSIGGTLGSTNSSNNSGGAGGQWKSATIGGASEETSKTTDDILSVPFSLLSPTTATKKALSSNNIASYDVGAATTEKSGFLFGISSSLSNASNKPILSNIGSGIAAHIGGISTNLGWKKIWCVVANGNLQEFSDWKKHMDVANIIPLKLLTVREARNVDRRFCFEIVGPQIARRIYQATDSEEMRDWITVIQNAIEQALTEGFSGTVVYSPSGTLRGGGGGGGAGGGAGAGENQTTVPFEADPSLKTFTQIYSDHRKPVLEAARQADESNYNCADCGTRLPDWASINLGCLVCIECSGIHRSLGTHITKIRSMTLDTASWTPELVMVIEMLGNARVNAVFEATCDPRLKPTPHSTREQKTSFIKEKYISKIYTDRSGAVLQSCKVASANELLRHAVSLADIPLALNAIALGGGDSTTMASNNSSSSNNYSSRPILFDALKLPLLERSQKCREQDMAMAEFLLQNGVSTASALDITPIPVTSDTSSTSNNPSIYLDSMARFMSKQDFRGSGFVTFNLSLLHHAAYQRDVDLIALLISKGADPTAKDKLGRTPLDMVGDQPAATGGKVTEILSGGEQDLSSPNSLSENDRIVVCSMKLREAVSKWDQYK